MMPSISSHTVADMLERFQSIIQDETSRYICDDYATDSVALDCPDDEKTTITTRLEGVLGDRRQTLENVYYMAKCLGIDESIASNAAFIIDRYLSIFAPRYINSLDGMPQRFDVIGVASLLVAAKFLMAVRDLGPIETFLSDNPFKRDIIDAEQMILVKLNWAIVYPSPISIIQDMLIIMLPRPCGYLWYDNALGSFKCSILDESSYLAKLAATTYGYTTKFSPFTIAIAVITIALENQSLTRDSMLVHHHVSPVIYFTSNVETLLGLSCHDDDIKQCHERMIRLHSASSRRDALANSPRSSLADVTGNN